MELVAEKYKITEVGLIPSDWEVKPLGNISYSIASGKSSTNNFEGGNYPIYGSTGIIGYCNQSDYYGNKILVARVGANAGTVNGVNGEYCVSDNTLMVALKIESDFTFVQYYLKYSNLNKLIFGSGQPLITGSQLKQLQIPLPPTKAEQTSIATALSDADSYISSLEKLIVKKRLLKHGAMQQLLSPKEGDALSQSKGWVVKKVSDLCDVGRGRVISHREINASMHSSYPVYSSQTSNDGVMGFIDTYDFDGEYITWTTDGEKAGTVFYRNGKFNCTNVCGTLKLKKGNAKYFAIALNQIASKHVSRNLANPKLMNDVMKKVEVPMPSPEEQTRIATILSDMDTGIAALEKQLAKARSIKQGMMQQLLTGKIRLV
jgi:type I restriction enzyme, S subunit